MKKIKKLMFQMKISLVVMPIRPKQTTLVNTSTATTNSVEQSCPTKNDKIFYHFTADSEYTEAVLFSRAGKANGKTKDDLMHKIVMIDQQYP